MVPEKNDETGEADVLNEGAFIPKDEGRDLAGYSHLCGRCYANVCVVAVRSIVCRNIDDVRVGYVNQTVRYGLGHGRIDRRKQ